MNTQYQIGNGLSSQGLIMAPADFVDAAWMKTFDAFGVIGATAFVSFVLYPWLARRGTAWVIKSSTNKSGLRTDDGI